MLARKFVTMQLVLLSTIMHSNICAIEEMEEEIVKGNAEMASRKASHDRKYADAALDFVKIGLIDISRKQVIQRPSLRMRSEHILRNVSGRRRQIDHILVVGLESTFGANASE